MLRQSHEVALWDCRSVIDVSPLATFRAHPQLYDEQFGSPSYENAIAK